MIASNWPAAAFTLLALRQVAQRRRLAPDREVRGGLGLVVADGGDGHEGR